MLFERGTGGDTDITRDTFRLAEDGGVVERAVTGLKRVGRGTRANGQVCKNQVWKIRPMKVSMLALGELDRRAGCRRG